MDSTSGTRVAPDSQDRILGLLGLLFFGFWAIVFPVLGIAMVIILVGGANGLAEPLLLAVLCVAATVYNGLRLRRSWRRLRGKR